VEDTDLSLDAALRREVLEELGGKAEIQKVVLVVENLDDTGAVRRQHFHLCRLTSWSVARRSGPEFGDPTRGEYTVEEVPLNEDALAALDIRPTEAKEFLIAHLADLRDPPEE
jgi:8-oxo-dGTP pyrophosphatase MutT (NUDIX family)